MLGINTNLYALNVQNEFRKIQLDFSHKNERLSSGQRINRGEDDPSGLAISKGMEAQVRGLLVDMQNIQDGINLLQYVDAFVNDLQSIMFRVRDLSVRLANTATLSVNPGTNANDLRSSDMKTILTEIYEWGNHAWRMTTDVDETGSVNLEPFASFNTKHVFTNSFALGGEALQVGPDGAASHHLDIIIEDVRQVFQNLYVGVGFPPSSNINGMMDANGYLNQAKALIENADTTLNKLSDIRATLGTQHRTLLHTWDDVQAQYINISAGKSRIQDADFAEEAVGMARNQILQQSSQAAAAQANVQPMAVMDLLGAIYDGLSPELARQGAPQPGGA